MDTIKVKTSKRNIQITKDVINGQMLKDAGEVHGVHATRIRKIFLRVIQICDKEVHGLEYDRTVTEVRNDKGTWLDILNRLDGV